MMALFLIVLSTYIYIRGRRATCLPFLLSFYWMYKCVWSINQSYALYKQVVLILSFLYYGKEISMANIIGYF